MKEAVEAAVRELVRALAMLDWTSRGVSIARSDLVETDRDPALNRHRVDRATLAGVGRSPEAKDLVHTIMEECVVVARAIGVELPISIDRRLQAALAVGDHKTSMLQDREAGKPLEADCMTGAVIEIAETLSLPVPYTRTVHACIWALEELRQGSGRRSLSQEPTAG